MKQLLTLFVICFAFKAISQPVGEAIKYWKVGKSDTSAFVICDTLFHYDNNPGWDTLAWEEDVDYTKARTILGEVDTVKRYFFQYRMDRTSGHLQKRTVYLEKWYLELPKPRAQQILDSINQID